MKTLKTLSLILILTLSVLFTSAQKSVSNIDKITTAYLGVKNALAASNGTAAGAKGKELFDALSADPDKGLKPDQQKLFDSYLDKLKYDSRHISETSDVEHQREHFASLSKNLYAVLKGLKMNTSTIYMEYCPMKKAYWLSETSAIKNPYYSDKMMTTCGRVAATLPAGGK
ncbi:MAG TPA: DUF3347 domain-containing protein [Mucilaginibacter sp.]|jgi:hypothetical protein